MLVKDRMTRNPITATPETTHKQASEMIKEHDVHHLPILDRRGKLVGMVTENDLYDAQPSPATTLSIYEIHGLLSRMQLKQIMKHPVITVGTECELEEAAGLMLREDVSCLPVMDGDKLIGMITDSDIFRAFVELLGGEQDGGRFTFRCPDEPGQLAKVAQAVANAGGNIIAVTSWNHREKNDSFITIKEQGANYEALMVELEKTGTEVVDEREHSRSKPVKFE